MHGDRAAGVRTPKTVRTIVDNEERMISRHNNERAFLPQGLLGMISSVTRLFYQRGVVTRSQNPRGVVTRGGSYYRGGSCYKHECYTLNPSKNPPSCQNFRPFWGRGVLAKSQKPEGFIFLKNREGFLQNRKKCDFPL